LVGFFFSLENSSEANDHHITILNEDGEPVGIAVNQEEDEEEDDQNSTINNPATSITTGSRKRRASAKYRESLLQSELNFASSKKIPKLPPHAYSHQHGSNTATTLSRSSEVEIDVSDVNFVRLKTNNNNNKDIADRQEEILQYLQRVDDKLNCILKHFNVPHNPSPSFTSPTSETRRQSSSGSRGAATKWSRYSMLTGPGGSGGSNRNMPTSTVRTQVTRGADGQQQEIHFLTTAESSQQQEITQYVISDDLLEATFSRSRNRGNFAKNLVFVAFPLEERLGRNCFGRRGGSLSGPKEPLEAAKLDAVRDAVFRKFPVTPDEDEDAVWKKECVIAIDTALRSEMRQRILAINGSESNHQLIKGELS